MDRFFKAFNACYGEDNSFPADSAFWDDSSCGCNGVSCRTFSCSSCYGHFKSAAQPCTGTTILDPVNQSPLAYCYFYFSPTATTYQGVPISDDCKGKFAFMAHLETSKYMNSGCFHQNGYYEYWRVLGY